jgi:hypothetical protein
MGVLLEGISPFIIISSLIILRMGNISDRFVDKNKIYILFSVTFSRKLCLL